MDKLISISMTIVVILCIYISIDTLNKINSGIIKEVVQNETH
jgi:hypothetical protein